MCVPRRNKELEQRNAGSSSSETREELEQRNAPVLAPMAPPFHPQPVLHGSQPQLAHPNQIGAFQQQHFGASLGGQQQFGAIFGAQHMMPGGLGG
eukprot:361245-Rhodomonas_salina.1